MRELRAAGKTLPEAAAALGLSRQLTGRFWRAASAEALLKVRGASALDPWKPYLRRRWDAGITKIAVLHREITALGYAGSEPTTYAWLALLKLAAPPKPPAPPAKRQVTRWMLTDPARLDAGQQDQLAAILGRCPELQALAGHVTAFAKILTRRRRRPPGRLARRRRGQPRPARARLVRQRHPPGLPGRPQRPDPGLELRPRRRPQHPHQTAQTPDVRTGILPAPPQAHPPDQLKHQPRDHPEICDRAKYKQGNHRIGMQELRRRFCDQGWRFAYNGVVFTGASSVAVTRYRYRGSTIPTPWTPAPASR